MIAGRRAHRRRDAFSPPEIDNPPRLSPTRLPLFGVNSRVGERLLALFAALVKMMMLWEMYLEQCGMRFTQRRCGIHSSLALSTKLTSPVAVDIRSQTADGGDEGGRGLNAK